MDQLQTFLEHLIYELFIYFYILYMPRKTKRNTTRRNKTRRRRGGAIAARKAEAARKAAAERKGTSLNAREPQPGETGLEHEPAAHEVDLDAPTIGKPSMWNRTFGRGYSALKGIKPFSWTTKRKMKKGNKPNTNNQHMGSSLNELEEKETRNKLSKEKDAYKNKLNLCIKFLQRIGEITGFNTLTNQLVIALHNCDEDLELGTSSMRLIYVHLPNICSDSTTNNESFKALFSFFGGSMKNPNPAAKAILTKHEVCIIFLEESRNMADRDISPIIGQTIHYLIELKPQTTDADLQGLYTLIPKVCFDENNDLNVLIKLNETYSTLQQSIANQEIAQSLANQEIAQSLANQERENRALAQTIERANREGRGYF